MAKPKPIFTRETFRFFQDLARHNKKTWMDANRERYQESVVRPFRRLLDETAPAVLALDSRFDTAARNGEEFFAHQSRHSVCERQDAVSPTDVSEVLRCHLRATAKPASYMRGFQRRA